MEKNIVKLHRVFAASPDKVYKAFTNAEAMASWLPPYGFVCKVFSMEVKLGGKYRMAFTNFTTDKCHAFEGEYLEIIPNKYLKIAEKFDDPNLAGIMITTIVINEVQYGTELIATQENIPDEMPIDGCYLGWQDSLDKLKRLVEPNIPDE